MQKVITDDLDALVDILPPHIRQPLSQQKDIKDLLEVVLDLGRPPEARFPQREVALSPKEVDVRTSIMWLLVSAALGMTTGLALSAPCTAYQPFVTAKDVL